MTRRLTYLQATALTLLAEDKWRSVKGMHRAGWLDITSSVMRGLVKRGYVETGKQPGSRGTMYSITKAGKAALYE